MERDRLKLAFAGHFFSFKPPSKPKKKIKILKKCKKLLEISSLCTCSPKIMIIWCTVPQIWSETDRNFFVILSHFLPFYPLPNDPKKSKFCKNKNAPGDIIILHMCTKNHNHIMYASWDTECNRCFCHFEPFFAL